MTIILTQKNKELKKENPITEIVERILINTFIYKIYLYDEKMVINYTT